MQIVPVLSRLSFLDLLTPQLTAWCHLYVNDPALGWWTDKEDLHEPDVPGYSPQAIFGWQDAILSGPFARAQADPVLFTRDDPGDGATVAGYFITHNQDGALLVAERFTSAPLNFASSSDSLLIVPRVQLRAQQEVTSEPALPTVGAGGWTVPGEMQPWALHTAGPLYPSTANYTGSPPGNVWTNLSAIVTENGDGPTSPYKPYTQTLYATGFGFALPAGAIIQGILVEWKRRISQPATVTDRSITLWSGGGPIGTDQAAGATWPTSFTWKSYGGAGELWGASLTPAVVNDAGFGVALACQSTLLGSAIVDTARVTITYASP